MPRKTLAALAAAILAFATIPAYAQYVPSLKGNDTGGIIAYASVQHLAFRDVVAIADGHCAAYQKGAKILSVHASYGDYISFACDWRLYRETPAALRVAY